LAAAAGIEPVQLDAELEMEVEVAAPAPPAPPAEEAKPKKSRKKAADNIPADLTDHQRELWEEFAKSTMAELRQQCENNNLKTSKRRNEMIMALITHRIALEDGDPDLSEQEEEDDLAGDYRSHSETEGLTDQEDD
jgi:hypothetical protein